MIVDTEKETLTSWSEQLMAYKLDGRSVISQIVFSSEFASKNLTDEEYVDTLYQTMFQEHYEAYDDKGNMGYNESPQNSGFYGIWFFATKSYEEAEVAAAECCQNGFEGQVYVTSDWSNLNSETWYVVTAGIYTSTADAEAMLPYVQYVYPDAYIKYTGEWRG